MCFFDRTGHYVLIYDPTLLAVVKVDQTIKTSRVIAVDGSGKTPVDADDKAMYATWAPNVDALAYVVRDYKNPDNNGLYVTPAPGAPGQLLYKGTVFPVGGNWRMLTWANNNTILIKRTGDVKTPVALLHLIAE